MESFLPPLPKPQTYTSNLIAVQLKSCSVKGGWDKDVFQQSAVLTNRVVSHIL